MYFGYNEPIDNNIKTVERLLKFTKRKKLLLAIDSNSRSTTWHDIKTNPRGKLLEEFLAYNQLHILNEDSERKIFQSCRWSSKIDLTIANNHMLAAIKDWKILEEENCWDQNIIEYNLTFNPDKEHKCNSQGPRFIMKEDQHADFQQNFRRELLKNFETDNNGGNISEIDERLAEKLTSQEDVGLFVDRIENIIRTTCNETFKQYTSLKSIQRGNLSLGGRQNLL